MAPLQRGALLLEAFPADPRRSVSGHGTRGRTRPAPPPIIQVTALVTPRSAARGPAGRRGLRPVTGRSRPSEPATAVACAHAQGRTARQPDRSAAGHAPSADPRRGRRDGAWLRGERREPAPHVRARQGGAARARRAGGARRDGRVGQRRRLLHRPEGLRHAGAAPRPGRAGGDPGEGLPTAEDHGSPEIPLVRAGRAAARMAELRGAEPVEPVAPDGRVTLKLPVVDRGGFLAWVLGNDVEVVEPTELRAEAVRRLTRLEALVGDATA